MKHNNIITVFCALLHIQLLSGSSLSDQVHQTPPDMFRQQGQTAQIQCSHSIQSYNQILWYKQREGRLQFLGYMYGDQDTLETGVNVKIEGNANKDQNCTLTTEALSSSAVYYCAARDRNEAYFGAGTKLTILEPELDIVPPTVKVLKPSKNECNQEKKKTLVCVASDFYPDHVKVHWQVDGVEVTEGVATDNAAWRNGTGKNYTITSRLMVNETTWYTPSNKFKCIVRFYDGAAYVNKEDSVNGDKAQIKHKSPLTRERYLRVTQGAKLSYGVFIIKSCTYGAFVAFLVWKLQKSAEKQST